VYIKNLKENAKFLSLLKINTSSALCISIEKLSVTALILNNLRKVKNNNSVEVHPDGDIKIPLQNLGNVIDFSGECLFDEAIPSSNVPETHWENDTVDVIKGLQKAPYRRKIVSKQIYTGHMRIDLNQPMVENNFILLKGPYNSGKHLVVQDMIKYFLQDDQEGNRRVVYVTPNIKTAKDLHQNVLDDDERAKWTVLTPRQLTSGNAELYLMPRSALVIAQKLRKEKWNVLFVFDKIVEYNINERQIFNNANQPFSPTNIFNEIMENSGDFGPNDGVMTSVCVMDIDTMNIEHSKQIDNLRTHLESITDQIIDFDPTLRTMRSSLPKLDLVRFSSTNIDYWQKPFVASVRKELEDLAKLLKDSHKSNTSKKELGIQEDPWENYLFYDSQFILPLINHKEPLSIVEQILVFKFIHRTVTNEPIHNSEWNEWISEFKAQPKTLIQNLLAHANEYQFKNDKTILDIISSHLSKNQYDDGVLLQNEMDGIKDQVDEFLRSFYTSTESKGGLRAHKLDYWKNVV